MSYTIGFLLATMVLFGLALWYNQKFKSTMKKESPAPKPDEPAAADKATATTDKDKKKEGDKKDKKEKAWYEEYPNTVKVLVLSFCFIAINVCLYLTFPQWYVEHMFNLKVFTIESVLAVAFALRPTKKGSEPAQEVMLRRTTTIAIICLIIFLVPFNGIVSWFQGQPEKMKQATRSTNVMRSSTPCISGIEPEPGVEEAVRKVFGKQEDLIFTVKCYESGMRHRNSTGKVLENINADGSIDVGVFQINNRVHATTIEELKVDLYNLTDNIRMAKHLYDKYGIEPWRKDGRVVRFDLKLNPKEGSQFFILPQHGKYVSLIIHPDNLVRQLFVYTDGSTEEIAHGPGDQLSPSKNLPLRQTMLYAERGAKITMQYIF